MSKEKDNVIQFPNINQDEEIQYDEIMADNPYFRLTFINALHAMGLPCNTESVKIIQRQMEEEETGIVGIAILLYCSNVFEPPIRQEILNNIDVVFYIYGIIGASNIYNSIQTKTFSVSDYIEVLAQKNEGPDSFAIFDKLGCNPCHEENIRKTFENYNNLLENTKDLIYEKKLKRRKNGI